MIKFILPLGLGIYLYLIGVGKISVSKNKDKELLWYKKYGKYLKYIGLFLIIISSIKLIISIF
jgi:hypothetical protein